MTSTAPKAPWILARSAQVAIAVAAVADAFRAAAVRDHYLRHTDASLHKSGFISMIFAYLMSLTIVLFLVWLARSRHNAQELSPGPRSRVGPGRSARGSYQWSTSLSLAGSSWTSGARALRHGRRSETRHW